MIKKLHTIFILVLLISLIFASEYRSKSEVFDFFLMEHKPEIIGGFDSIYDVLNYPKQALKLNISGHAVLEFVCTQQGGITDIRVIEESPHGYNFGVKAIDALHKLKFLPGKLNQTNVCVKMKLPIFFKPTDQ